MNILRRNFLYISVAAMLSGCSIPQIDDLRSLSPNTKFQVTGTTFCIYTKSVEHVSSYIGMSEPKFTWFISDDKRHAWFRQPLTLVELKSSSDQTTEVLRKQTSSAQAFGQGDDLLAFIKNNPCDKKDK